MRKPGIAGVAVFLAGVFACSSETRSGSSPGDRSPDASKSTTVTTSDSGGPSVPEAGAPDAQPDAGNVVGAPPTGTPPVLTPGVWKEITPPGVNLATGCCTAYPNVGFNGNTFGATALEIEAGHPYTLLLSVDVEGIWKTTDGGSTWKRLGTVPAAPTNGETLTYLDSPIGVRIDPDDPQHLYATEGVRGNALGFWVSHDGGETWKKPAGFVEAEKSATNDVTTLVVDPTDFKHVLIGSHSPWANNTVAGILETKDGGETFVLHPSNWPSGGSIGINFFFDRALGIGSSATWLVSTDGAGMFLTDDSAKTWKKVSDMGAVHGGNGAIYFTANHAAYAGGNNTILRSTDQGMSWSAVGPHTQDGYYQIIGDGNVLYAQSANTGKNTTGPTPYLTSLETDGVTWTLYQGGAQTFTDGPCSMRFDPVNRILYSANWDGGLWALKVLPSP
jgi:photosystem II stability/assembly factor-like uncharacterized protein